ncbi:MAG TPA: hypothetical protein PLU23_05130, partial [Anaerolineaceae bacterium]|nr:hypothetical protein [Anaerolineaceae bacterium]
MKKTKIVLVLLSLILLLSILPTPTTAQTNVNCGNNSDIQDILDQMTETSVAKWIRDLSGEDPV